jgi:DNA end-binding protein Ku
MGYFCLMATVSTRTLWKGAISFGLVHIPVALHSAIEDNRPKMRMLEQETGAPIGHRNVNKATGEAVAESDIVKGLEIDKGRYVTLTKEEIREALPKTTQTIEIESFVKLDEVPIVFFNKPYYTSPINKGQKVYALLREVLHRTGRVGLGRIVVSTKQHLAIVAPMGDGLVVNLVRWAEEIRDMKGLSLPGPASSVGVTDREIKMGEQLVLDLADKWHPERFRDEFKEKLEALVEQKRKAGAVKEVVELLADEITPATSADVIDLTELLRQSLKAKGGTARTAKAPREAANDETPARRAAAASKSTAKSRASVKPKPRKSA